MNTRKTLLTLILLWAGLFAATAHADTISLALNNPTQAAADGLTLQYTATISASSGNGSTVFLNGDSFTFASPFNLDDSPYLANFPLSLDPGQSYTDVLFDIAIPAGTAAGSYFGSFQITGGADDAASGLLASADFSTAVTPEPSSLLLMATGLAGAVGVARRRLTL